MEMTWVDIVSFIIALIIMLIGLAGTVLPVIPGTPIIFIAALLYALITGFVDITGQTLAIFAVMTGAALALDWVATVFGVKKMGGSYFGAFGSLVGMIIGLIIPGVGIVGFIVGAFVGAVVFEMLIGKEMKVAVKAGLGSFVGFMLGGVMKFAIASTMIGIFVWRVLIK